MTPEPRIDPGAIRKEFKAFITANDASGFVALCQTLKAEIAELVLTDRSVEAVRLLEAYNSTLREYEPTNPAFTLEVLPLLPPNARGTIKLLGVCDDTDAYILEHKVNLEVISQVQDDAFSFLITWALSKKDMAYVEKVVLSVTESLHTMPLNLTTHPMIDEMMLDATIHMLHALVYKDETRMVCTPAIDDAIASLMIKRPESKLQEQYFLHIAQAGMTKTLMKALSLPFFYSYSQADEQKQQILKDALPSNPTVKELYWIHRSLPLDGIAEKILFDETVDMDEFVNVLSGTYEGKSHYSDLSFHTLKGFTHLIDKQTLDTQGKQKRVTKLLNAMCEEEAFGIGRQKTPQQIRDELLKMGVPDFMLRTVNILKGQALEDALGL